MEEADTQGQDKIMQPATTSTIVDEKEQWSGNTKDSDRTDDRQPEALLTQLNNPTASITNQVHKTVLEEVKQVTEHSDAAVSPQISRERVDVTQQADSLSKGITMSEPTVISPKEWHYLHNHWLQGIMQAAMGDTAHPDIPNLADYKYISRIWPNRQPNYSTLSIKCLVVMATFFGFTQAEPNKPGK